MGSPNFLWIRIIWISPLKFTFEFRNIFQFHKLFQRFHSSICNKIITFFHKSCIYNPKLLFFVCEKGFFDRNKGLCRQFFVNYDSWIKVSNSGRSKQAANFVKQIPRFVNRLETFLVICCEIVAISESIWPNCTCLSSVVHRMQAHSVVLGDSNDRSTQGLSRDWLQMSNSIKQTIWYSQVTFS